MNSVLDYVRDGFIVAARRPHLVILDLSAQIVWLTFTIAAFVVAGIWFASEVQLTDNNIAAIRSGVSVVVVAALVQTIISNLSALAVPFTLAAVTCVAGWVMLEAFMRGGLLALTDQTFIQDATDHFLRFLWIGLMRRVLLGLALLITTLIVSGPLLTIPMSEWIQFWPDTRWAVLAGLGTVLLLALCLTTIETLIRSDALEVLGPHLSLVAGIVGILALVEIGVVLAVVAFGALAVQVVESLGGLVAVGIVLTSGLSVSHSYLILVRYTAIGVMRRDMRYGATDHASDL